MHRLIGVEQVSRVTRTIAVFCTIFSSLCIYSIACSADEYITFKIYEHKYKKKIVPVQLSLPSGSIQPPYPLIITQHGSTPDERFAEGLGNTYEYSHRLAKMARKRGSTLSLPLPHFMKKTLSRQISENFLLLVWMQKKSKTN